MTTNAAGAIDLINAGTDPNLAADRGRTPLSIAAFMGQLQPVKALLGIGGDPSIPDTRSGRDAADLAMDRGYSEVAVRTRSATGIAEYVSSENSDCSGASIGTRVKRRRSLFLWRVRRGSASLRQLSESNG